VVVGGVAVLPGASGGDDKRRQVTASPMVQEAVSIASRDGAGVRPELTVAAAISRAIPAEISRAILAAWSCFRCGNWRRRKREGGLFIGGGRLAEGARVCAGIALDGGGDVVLEPGTSQRWKMV
jgi:hypothetical protein